MATALLAYNRTKQANRALRWLTRLAKKGNVTDLRVLVLAENEADRLRLTDEVTNFAGLRGVAVEIETVQAKRGLSRMAELARQVEPGIVAMPSRVAPMWLSGGLRRIRMKALKEIHVPILLFM